MLPEQTIEKLKDLRLPKMAETFRKMIEKEEYSSLSFEERVGVMVDAECTNRRNNRLVRLTHMAKLAIPEACIENIRYDTGRKIDKNLVLNLSFCSYIKKSRNVIIQGATGTGKSYLACALGQSAITNFYTVKYIRLPDLFNELDEARVERRDKKVISDYKKVSLLILDEWLTLPLRPDDAHDLLEIIDARYGKASTIFCTQLEVGGWYEKIGEPICADAICDRIINNAYTIRLEGDSMRKVLNSEKEDSSINKE